MKPHSYLLAFALALVALLAVAVVAEKSPVEKVTTFNVVTPATNVKQLDVSGVSVNKMNVTRQTASTQSQSVDPYTPERPTVLVDPIPLQAGDDIASATPITSMPFLGTGTTVGYTDDYEEDCANFDAPTPDVVYSYTPTQDELLTVDLCNSSFFTNSWIYENDTNTIVACQRFSNTCDEPNVYFHQIPIYAGNTYYIVIDGDKILTTEGEYEISCTVIEPPEPFDPHDEHPTMAEGASGYFTIGYQTEEIDEQFNVDSVVIWFGSIDDGTTFMSPIYYTLDDIARDPAIDYWGDDSIFYGTMVPGPNDASGAPLYVMEVLTPGFSYGYSLTYWDFSSYGWSNMLHNDIAAHNGALPWEYGMMSFIASTTYTTPAMTAGPHISYQTTEEGQGTISWLIGDDENPINGCATTAADIDAATNFAFAVYDWLDTDDNTWKVIVRQELFGVWDEGSSAVATIAYGSALEHLQYPRVASYDRNIIVAAELHDENAGEDRDIIVLRTDDGNVTNLAPVTVIASTDSERYPDVEHIGGTNFVLSFHRNDSLFLSTTEDGGATWSPEIHISGDDYVVADYHGSDIADGGRKVIWQYNPDPLNSDSILIHFAETGVVADSDGDGVADDIDNCPDVPNPDQLDADGDGIGDACDECTDTDGDGFGDPGYAANTCPDDNCPDIANPDQADADADGIGDVCDDCTDTDGDGYGDPGYAANTCAEDNCPDVANPDQADTDSDGIGDACCCEGIRGNFDGDPSDVVNIQDLTALVDYLFAQPPGPPSGCPNEDNIDGEGAVNVQDLTYLVDYLFAQPPGPAPVDCP